MKDLSQLATDVMKEVAQGHLVKQAANSYTKEDLKTDMGKTLHKVAEQLRIANSSDITYTDLARFRKNHGL